MDFLDNRETDELIRRCRERDDAAFSELLTRYTPMISRVVASFDGAALSRDELFSEACASLHSAAMRYNLEQSEVTFGLFARICVHNRLVDLLRAAERTPTCDDCDVDSISDGESIESEILLRDTVDRLMSSARATLSDYEYRVLLLYMQGYKTAEISRLLDRDSKSVDNAKSRIFTRLRRAFGSVADIK